MASGLAKRFGSNKLLAEFDRKPLLCRAFAVTEGLHRVVVTRSTEVQALCEKYGIPVLHHAHPLRSDTVRLGLECLLPRFPAMSGCVFLPGDQPLLTRKTLCGMVSAFCAEPDRKSQIFRLCEPQSGTPGSPVLFGADYFEELRSLPEGRGRRRGRQAACGKGEAVSCKASGGIDGRGYTGRSRRIKNDFSKRFILSVMPTI